MIYLTISRLDLNYIVGPERQFMMAPKNPHLDAVRCILCYVRATLDYALFDATNVEISLFGYANAYWAGSATNCRSTSGFMFSFGSGAVTWSSKK